MRLAALAPLLGLAVCLAYSAPALAQPQFSAPGAPTSLTPQQQAARAIYQQLVEINTVDSVGSVTQAAEAMAVRFRAAGFAAQDVQLLGPADAPEKHNLVVRYRGKGGGKPILLLAHLDVVAAFRADWPRDPFVMHEANGFFFGRGAEEEANHPGVDVLREVRAGRLVGIVTDRDVNLTESLLVAWERAQAAAGPAGREAIAQRATRVRAALPGAQLP